MTTRRLAKLEMAAAPLPIVRRWLADVHAFATLVHYSRWLLGQPAEQWPFALLPEQAAGRVRDAMGEWPELEILRAQDEAVAETIFLIELVLHLNAVSHEQQRTAAQHGRLLLTELGALAIELDMLDMGDSRASEGGSSVAERGVAWRAAVSTRTRSMACAEEARRLLEQRYLGGQPALFPGLAEAWAAVRDALGELESMADEVLGSTTVPTTDDPDGTASVAQAGHLADAARVAALGMLGDSNGVRAVAARRLGMASRVPPQ